MVSISDLDGSIFPQAYAHGAKKVLKAGVKPGRNLTKTGVRHATPR
jgi:hypothetical protein